MPANLIDYQSAKFADLPMDMKKRVALGLILAFAGGIVTGVFLTAGFAAL